MIKVQKSSSYNFKDTMHLNSSHELYRLFFMMNPVIWSNVCSTELFVFPEV